MSGPSDDIASVKAQIATYLCRLTTDRQLTQTEAGALMGIAPGEVSRLFGDGAPEYSIDRLMGFLTAFDQDVEITVRPHPKAGEGGRITFTLATA